ncbi:MAG: DUF1249 domain-containing protein [Gammaproteobacteria bacterium]
MLADSYIVPQCRAEPRSLGALMALYEGNFIKLTSLAPALKSPTSASAGISRISRSSRDLDLHLCVDAVTRYTVDLRLTYLFDDPAGVTSDPDLHLRLYLDARMVEVISWSVTHRHEVLRQLAASSYRELDRRWSQNIMLGKWLDYLGDMGHNLPG